MAILTIILFCILPILSSILIVFGMIYDSKHTFIYSILISLILAIFAYNYVPTVNEDLYQHLHTVSYIRNSFSNNKAITFDLTEPISLGIKYLVAYTNNANLLQFIVSFISYLLIFYITTTFLKQEKISTKILIISFVISTFNFLTVISNLFCNLALLIFSVGIYREYFLNKKGKINLVICSFSFLIHNSLIFPICILLIFRLCKNKINFKSIVSIILILIALPIVIGFLSNFNNIVINELCKFYNSYFTNQGEYAELHTKNTIIIYMLKLLPFIMAYIGVKDKKELTDGERFIMYLTVSLLALTVLTTFSIRFIPIVIMLGTPTILKFIKQKYYKDMKVLFCAMLIVLTLGYFYYQYKKIDFSRFILSENFIITNIVSIWGE